MEAKADGTTAAPLATPKSRGRPKATGTPKSTGGNKRKTESPNAGSGDVEDGSPSKKRQTGSKVSAGGKAMRKVKQETQGDGENINGDGSGDVNGGNDTDMHENDLENGVV